MVRKIYTKNSILHGIKQQNEYYRNWISQAYFRDKADFLARGRGVKGLTKASLYCSSYRSIVEEDPTSILHTQDFYEAMGSIFRYALPNSLNLHGTNSSRSVQEFCRLLPIGTEPTNILFDQSHVLEMISYWSMTNKHVELFTQW